MEKGYAALLQQYYTLFGRLKKTNPTREELSLAHGSLSVEQLKARTLSQDHMTSRQESLFSDF